MTAPILLSGPVEEPVTLDEAKSWLRMDGIDSEDIQIQTSVTAAREWFETACDRSFTTATWELRLGVFGGWIEIPYPPTLELVEIQYRDSDGVWQTLATTVYELVESVVPARIQLVDGESWPTTAVGPEVIKIVFRAGTGNVPEMVKVGIKMLVAFWTTYRGDPINQSGRMGSPMATIPIPPQVMNLVWANCSHRY